jgi:alkylhydroperoxidase/carboxymuconolactone decarboxylase family protein YurZ
MARDDRGRAGARQGARKVATHLYPSGAALHAEEALAHGATVGELMDTLRIASALASTQGLQFGLAQLVELQGGGKPASKDWAQLAAELNPDFKRAFDQFLDGQMPGGLDARGRCLVKLAVANNPATADREVTRQALQEALKLGVDSEEIVEVMLLASMIGSHAFSNILDNISETLAKHSAK